VAVVLCCSRVLDLDSTACKEMLSIIKEFKVANENARKADAAGGPLGAAGRHAQGAAMDVEGGGAPGAMGGPLLAAAAGSAPPGASPPAAAAAAPSAPLTEEALRSAAETLGTHTRLLLSSMPGPVRDILDSFNRDGLDVSATRFLSLGAAVAYLKEVEVEKEEWGEVARDISSLPTNERLLDASLFYY
jgi:hypothetical protein